MSALRYMTPVKVKSEDGGTFYRVVGVWCILLQTRTPIITKPATRYISMHPGFFGTTNKWTRWCRKRKRYGER